MSDSHEAFLDFSKRKNMKPRDIADMFSGVAGVYEDVYHSGSYKIPVFVTDGVADYFPHSVRPDRRILDVAAGTGMLAQELWNKGFRKLDGLDPSAGMRDEAMKKNIYSNYFVEFMDGKPIEGVKTDTYDCIVMSGGFNTGLVPCRALLEMARLVKPGGLICFSMCERFIKEVEEYANRFEPLTTLMEEDGIWDRVDKRLIEFEKYTDPTYVYRYIVRTSDVEQERYYELLKITE